MGYGLDSPGNQPIGEMFRNEKKHRKKCTNHNRRYAVALWGRMVEPVCLECLENCVSKARKRKLSKP